MLGKIDPDVRRALLEEIAFQRRQRGGFRRIAADEAEPYGVQLKARMRGDACNRAIRALRDVWDALEVAGRREMVAEMAADQRTFNRLCAFVGSPA